MVNAALLEPAQDFLRPPAGYALQVAVLAPVNVWLFVSWVDYHASVQSIKKATRKSAWPASTHPITMLNLLSFNEQAAYPAAGTEQCDWLSHRRFFVDSVLVRCSV